MKYAFTFLVFIVVSFLSFVTHAQFQGAVYQADTSVKVLAYGNQQTLAWCGGFDKAQFAMADLNHDGKQDLIMFTPWVGIRTFINTAASGMPQYVYAPEYELNFPPVTDYLVLADYNCDNIADLFTQQSSYGFVVYKGYYNTNNQLCFTFYKTLTYIDSVTNSAVPAYNNPGNIPAIVDVDGDGDLDFLALDVNGAEIAYYKNLRVEMSLPCDSIYLKLQDNKWGKEFFPFSSCYGGGQGATMCVFDYDSDGDYDLLEGTISCYNMRLFMNERIPYNASGPDSIIIYDSTWQTNGTTITLPSFPAAFNLDIDQDGKKNILVAPSGSGENYNCYLYYKNNSTPGNPSWSFQSDSFLFDKTIDLGTAAYPQFFDFNKDGKPDLFIGSDGYYQTNDSLRSRISYYLNTSTPGNPSLTLQTTDFLGINSYDFKGIAPAFGDLDNDGVTDMVIGHTDGTLSFFKNMAASDNVQPQWQLSQLVLKDVNNVAINVGSNAAPFVYDMDKDGKPDLIIGAASGDLRFYRNMSSSAGSLSLKLANDSLGHAMADPNYAHNSLTTPFIGKIDNTGIDYILLGSSSGYLYRYDNFQHADTGANVYFTLIDSAYSYVDTLFNYYKYTWNASNTLPKVYYNGYRSAPTVADIDGDGKYEMIVGDVYGGVRLYEQKLNVVAGVSNIAANSFEVKVYPNPASDIVNVIGSNIHSATANISVTDITGKFLLQKEVLATNKNINTSIDIKSFAAGLYLLTMKAGGEQKVTKLVKR